MDLVKSCRICTVARLDPKEVAWVCNTVKALESPSRRRSSASSVLNSVASAMPMLSEFGSVARPELDLEGHGGFLRAL